MLMEMTEMLPKKIGREELKRKMDRVDKFTLVDARSTYSYGEEHNIKAAISLPLDEVDEKAEQMSAKTTK